MSVDLVSALVRALSFIALFQAGGAAIFIAVFARQLQGGAEPVRPLGFASALAGLVLVSVHYSLEAARMAGTFAGVLDASLQQLVFDSSMRTAWGLRVGGLALIAFSFRGAGRGRTLAGVMGAALAIAGFLFVGHTASHTQGPWLAALLTVHLAIVAFWFGSLAPLHIVSRSEPALVVAAVVDRFSRIAVGSVPLILLAGALMALILVEEWSVFAQPYGALLLVKIAGFAALVLLAGLNKQRYGPAIAGDPRAAVAFRRTVAAEYLLICVVLIATAFMTTFFSPEQ